MQAACDRYLNIAPPDVLEYRVIGDYAYLQIATYGALVSEVPAWTREGWFSENEAAILLLVAAGRRRHGTWQPHGLAYFLPYLWVDNAYCITTGREVFGYPKELSWLQIPKDVRAPWPVTAETMVFPRYAADTPLQRKPVFEIAPPPDMGAFRRLISEITGGVKEMTGLLHALHGDLASNLVGLFATGEIGMVSLKQFREPSRPESACYQSIVNAVMKIERMNGWGVLPADPTVRFYQWDSHPVVSEFGIALTPDGPNSGTQKVALPFWLDADVTVDRCQNLYVSTDPA